MDPQQCIAAFIRDHEGGLSLDPVDSGNWHKGVLVGSRYGVTPAVLAAHRGVAAISPADMAALPLAEAVAIGFDRYYRRPALHRLAWNRVTASLLDMAWGAGPVQAILLFQRLTGAAADGAIGPRTAAACDAFLAAHGEAEAARRWADSRCAYYDRIIAARPANIRFRKGWHSRTASFLPGTPWWRSWS